MGDCIKRGTSQGGLGMFWVNRLSWSRSALSGGDFRELDSYIERGIVVDGYGFRLSGASAWSSLCSLFAGIGTMARAYIRLRRSVKRGEFTAKKVTIMEKRARVTVESEPVTRDCPNERSLLRIHSFGVCCGGLRLRTLRLVQVLALNFLLYSPMIILVPDADDKMPVEVARQAEESPFIDQV
jgi:hypothetical protein